METSYFQQSNRFCFYLLVYLMDLLEFWICSHALNKNINTMCKLILTEVWHMAHFWVSYGRCTMPGSPMGRSEGLSRRWAG